MSKTSIYNIIAQVKSGAPMESQCGKATAKTAKSTANGKALKTFVSADRRLGVWEIVNKTGLTYYTE